MTIHHPYKTILFDLDGTITDSAEGIINSVRYAIDKLGLPQLNQESINEFIGPPLANSFKKMCKISEEKAMEGITYYREYFKDKGIYENKLYTGIDLLLEKLAGHDINIVLATAKPTVFASKILIHFNLDKYFTAIQGSSLDQSLTQKKDIISYIFENHIPDAQKEECLMIGDREHDINGARENNIDSIGVTYGYGSPHELSKARPTFMFDTVSRLTSFLCSNANSHK